MSVGLLNGPMKYRDGYAGQLAKDAVFQLTENLWPDELVRGLNGFVTIYPKGHERQGIMVLRKDYAWDYASLPVFKRLGNWIQGKKSKVPSAAHDGLCQVERDGYLRSVPDARLHIDEYFKLLLDQRHFWKWRGRLWFAGVRIGARGKSSNKPVLEAK